jgi:hypothetical protein
MRSSATAVVETAPRAVSTVDSPYFLRSKHAISRVETARWAVSLSHVAFDADFVDCPERRPGGPSLPTLVVNQP